MYTSKAGCENGFVDDLLLDGILAQLGEHLPYKQRVIGSSPIGPIKKYYIIWRDSSVG